MSEHVIYIVFQTINMAAVPVCWRPTYDEAIEVCKQLSTPDTFRWIASVSDVPATPVSG